MAKKFSKTGKAKTSGKSNAKGLKTKENDVNVEEFIEKIENTARKTDCKHLLQIMKEITRKEPKMWGSSIVGFGHYHYKYPTGREGDWFQVGFSPRKQNLTIYVMQGFEKNQDLMEKLGTYTTGVSCLYMKSLNDVDESILRELIKRSAEYQYQPPNLS